MSYIQILSLCCFLVVLFSGSLKVLNEHYEFGSCLTVDETADEGWAGIDTRCYVRRYVDMVVDSIE